MEEQNRKTSDQPQKDKKAQKTADFNNHAISSYESKIKDEILRYEEARDSGMYDQAQLNIMAHQRDLSIKKYQSNIDSLKTTEYNPEGILPILNEYPSEEEY